MIVKLFKRELHLQSHNYISGDLGVLYAAMNYRTTINTGLVLVSAREVYHDSNQVIIISCGRQCTQKTYSSAAITVMFLDMLLPPHYH